MTTNKEISQQNDTVERKKLFDPTINITHILTTAAMMGGIFTWVSANLNDIKLTIATNMANIDNIKAERMREADELKDSIKELNLKVDRLIERGK